jgi:hypothetical protein
VREPFIIQQAFPMAAPLSVILGLDPRIHAPKTAGAVSVDTRVKPEDDGGGGVEGHRINSCVENMAEKAVHRL